MDTTRAIQDGEVHASRVPGQRRTAECERALAAVHVLRACGLHGMEAPPGPTRSGMNGAGLL